MCSGWVFFFRQNSNFYDLFWWNFFISFKKYWCREPKFEKIKKICDHFSQSYGALKSAILADLGQLTRDIFRAILTGKRRFNSSSKSFQISAKKLICQNWFVSRSKIRHFVFYMACGGIIFAKTKKVKKYIFFTDLKMQSEHSRSRPNTGSIVLILLLTQNSSTFVSKHSKYKCSSFALQTTHKLFLQPELQSAFGVPDIKLTGLQAEL